MRHAQARILANKPVSDDVFAMLVQPDDVGLGPERSSSNDAAGTREILGHPDSSRAPAGDSTGRPEKIACWQQEQQAQPGQFFMLHVDGFLLPRPLSVCRPNPDGTVFFLYQVVGGGTAKLASLPSGGVIGITGPLGNGFDVEAIRGYRRVALVSGGVGIAPMIGLAGALGESCELACYCGFAGDPYCVEELPNAVSMTGGFITDAFDAADYDLVCACGPSAFTRAVVAKCRAAKTKLLVSLDNPMACGVGACLGCVQQTSSGNRRVCADGPVFWGEELNVG